MFNEERSTSVTVYLDTSVISGYVNDDMKSSDSNAFQEIISMSQDKALVLCTSTVAREEIAKISTDYQSTHLEMYENLYILEGSITKWIDDDPKSTGFGNTVEDNDYVQLRNILPDENDARHLFQAKKSGVNDIITVDYKTILSKAKELHTQCGLNVYSPIEFLDKFST